MHSFPCSILFDLADGHQKEHIIIENFTLIIHTDLISYAAMVIEVWKLMARTHHNLICETTKQYLNTSRLPEEYSVSD